MPAQLPGRTSAQATDIAELRAQDRWTRLELVSDIHLHAGAPLTFEAWKHWLQTTQADAVFILGDLFEVWVGDDVLHSADHAFERECALVLQQAAQHRAVFFMHGNRDFLAADGLMSATGMTLLADPTVLDCFGQRWLLSHGDALCLGDIDYQRFRQQVRSPAWQQAFLSQTLPDRVSAARSMREQSEARRDTCPAAHTSDLDPDAVQRWLDSAHASVMIHGHTHRPADHVLGSGRQRVVMSDWDAHARPPRLQVLCLQATGLQRVSLMSAAA